MAKLVRKKGKLLRKDGKLVRSDSDLDPNSPCECCEDPPPPDPGSWFCNQRTGLCEFKLQAGGFATQALCQATCTKVNQTWNCVEGFCVGVVGVGGTYLTQAECLANCNAFP